MAKRKRKKIGLMVKCTPERGQKCSLFHLMVKCTPIIVELPSVDRGCKPLICFQQAVLASLSKVLDEDAISSSIQS